MKPEAKSAYIRDLWISLQKVVNMSTITNNNAAKWIYSCAVNKREHNNKPFISSVDSCLEVSRRQKGLWKPQQVFQIHLRTCERFGCVRAVNGPGMHEIQSKHSDWLWVSNWPIQKKKSICLNVSKCNCKIWINVTFI